jgi:hypothetical protein
MFINDRLNSLNWNKENCLKVLMIKFEDAWEDLTEQLGLIKFWKCTHVEACSLKAQPLYLNLIDISLPKKI